MIMSLRQYLQEARNNGNAIAHFNVSELATLKAIEDVVRELQSPVIVGTSEGEREFFGVYEIAALVHAMREKLGLPVFLNADHTKSIEKIQEAVEAGYDAVLFDAGAKNIDENITRTKEVVAWVHAYNEKHGTDVLVEGELGYIGTSSVLLDSIPEHAAYEETSITTAEDAKRFVLETGVDLIAPAVGNIHGMLKNAPNPQLHIDRIREIREQTDAYMVLHGGSGITDEQFKQAIKAGVHVVHINTEIRLAWRQGFDLAFVSNPGEIVPYKILPEAIDEIKKVLTHKINIFQKI